ncbi:MAG: hypothetical protein EON60_14265 [Alphaproteobacteria bacterium]|nr:MAG: hypothetical protein EON60_14265 [Alphaproteobacteria bacterium]
MAAKAGISFIFYLGIEGGRLSIRHWGASVLLAPEPLTGFTTGEESAPQVWFSNNIGAPSPNHLVPSNTFNNGSVMGFS